MTAQLRTQAEVALAKAAQLQDGGPESPLPLSPDALQAMLHDLQVHQIELQMQNEELLRAHIALDELRAHYFDLYDMAPVGYCTISASGYLAQANLTLATLLGLARGALMSKHFSLFLERSDRDDWYLLCKAQLASGEPKTCELHMLRHDGPSFWAELQVCVVAEAGVEPCLRVVVTDISARKADQAALEQSLRDKDALLREVHHRVKNNLQIMSSLLRMESSRSKDPSTKAVLTDMQGRIRSMALLHDTLYRSGTFSAVDLGAYLSELARQAFHLLAPRDGVVRLELDLAPLSVTLDLAIACGLLANELIVNSFKHGFADGRSGEVRIALQSLLPSADGKTVARLRVSDTGVGLGQEFHVKRGTTLGLQMVSDLSRQIGGTLEIEPNPEVGAAFTVTFAFEPLKSQVMEGSVVLSNK
jgi:PAS domain S-box-containing protein